MRVTCRVAVQPSSLTAKPKPPCKGSIELARKKAKKEGASDEHSLVIITQKKPESYAVVPENVDKVFKNVVHQGKLTIRFNAPAHTILISDANPAELSKLHRLIDQVLSTGSVSDPEQLRRSYTALKDQSTTKAKPRPKRMDIASQNDYPRDGFPDTLQHLKISAALRAVDIRWFRLHELVELDLANNLLSKIKPQDWSKFTGISRLHSLRRLSLQQNRFSRLLPEPFWKALPLSITDLDLSHNEFSAVPDVLFRLVNLRDLNLADNFLSKLPDDISQLPRLQRLNVSGNRLRYLPATLFPSSGRPRLEEVDLTGNRFEYPTDNYQPNRVGRVTVPLARHSLPSLVELAAAVVLQQRLRFADDDMPVLLRRSLRSLVERCCDCGKLFARSYSTERKLTYSSNSKVATNVITHHAEVAHSPVFGHLCGKCGKALAENRHVEQWQCEFETLAQGNVVGEPPFDDTPFLDLLSA
ncbi:peptidylprolyl isomerase-like 5 [Aphelenchoides avenae]|nr:peptidylprolyl isomerase-like 5 [Aphelenchus avenae]